MTKTYTQEEVDLLMKKISDLESSKQELVYRASPVPLNSKVINPIDNQEWIVVDIDFDFGKFMYMLEQPDNPKKGIQMLSENNISIKSEPCDGRSITMHLDDSKVSVKIKE